MAQTLLVTGGAGYVGSHVAALLVARGDTVVVLDDLTTGHAAFVPEGAELVVDSVHDRARVAALMRSRSFDAVLHFAALSQVAASMEAPYATLRSNLGGALNLVEGAVAAGIGRFVFSSSASVYGTPDRLPVAEDAPRAPQSPYGASKAMVEEALEWAERLDGLRVATLRYFNAAGADDSGQRGEAHDPETHLIPAALQCARGHSDELVVHGADYPTPDGTCVRDYVHVVDLAEAHLLALDALERRSVTYNLGSGSGTSVLEVVEEVRRVTGAAVPTRVGPRRPGDPPELVASSEAIRRELGWRPARSDLPTIVSSAWAWQRRRP